MKPRQSAGKGSVRPGIAGNRLPGSDVCMPLERTISVGNLRQRQNSVNVSEMSSLALSAAGFRMPLASACAPVFPGVLLLLRLARR